MTTQIPIKFCLDKSRLDWCDVQWGYINHLISWRDVVWLAVQKLTESPFDEDVKKLSCVGKDTVWLVSEQLEKIVRSIACHEDVVKGKWLYLVLSWLYDTRVEYPDPLGKVEQIYADFDYPDQITSFVRYMPPVDGRDTLSFNLQENIEAMMNYWRNYLKDAEKVYLFDGAAS
jgi:hypothetical protein